VKLQEVSFGQMDTSSQFREGKSTVSWYVTAKAKNGVAPHITWLLSVVKSPRSHHLHWPIVSDKRCHPRHFCKEYIGTVISHSLGFPRLEVVDSVIWLCDVNIGRSQLRFLAVK
jgi:hypothetical protein